MIPREQLEGELLRGLQDAVLREEFIDYVVERLGEELERHLRCLDSELENMRERKRQIETETARLVEAVASGQAPPSVMAAIAERDQELRRITDRLLEPRPGSVHAQIEQLRAFAVSRITGLRKLLAHQDSTLQARAMLAEQFGKITLAPVNDNGRLTYTAKGKVDFFSGSRVECVEGVVQSMLPPVPVVLPFEGVFTKAA